jgi:hypothetical protein
MTTRVPIRCAQLATLLKLVAVLAISLLASSVGAAQPDPLPIDVGWEGPASCPRSDDIDRDVRRFLGDIKLPETLPPIAARVSVQESSDGRFEVRMLTTSGGETRERALRTETCDEARDLVAFLLALLIDPRAREPSAVAAVTKPPPAEKPPPATREQAKAPQQPPKDESTHRFLAALAGTAEYGTLPSGSVGGELRMGVLFSIWSLEGRGAAWLPRHAESPDVPGAGGELSLFEAGILGCVRGAPLGGPALHGCAGGAVLSMKGEGDGVREPGSDSAVFAALHAEVGLLIAISEKVSLRPALGALVPFRRPTFAIHEVGTIHRPSAVAARASLGFEAQF